MTAECLFLCDQRTITVLHTIAFERKKKKIKRKSLMRESDWLQFDLRLIFLICVQMQVLCNGAYTGISHGSFH